MEGVLQVPGDHRGGEERIRFDFLLGDRRGKVEDDENYVIFVCSFVVFGR